MNGEMAINSVLYNRFKPSENGFVSMILFTFAMSLVNYIIRQATYYMEDIQIIKLLNIEFLLHKLYKKNSVEYEGKISCGLNYYNSELRQSFVFGNRFRAIWEHIISEKNPTIHSIKEQTMNKNQNAIYMVNQRDKFLVCKDLEIYAYTFTENETIKRDDDETKSKNKMTSIIIELYSYKSSTEEIKAFVEKITETHLAKLENERRNKRFIYTLAKLKLDNEESGRWTETQFESTRTFSNLFFDNKSAVIKKIDFFQNNRNWYFEKGIPYSLGIGMHGPPGTGKTSFIKALANYTKRNIVVISLKMLKTKRDLEQIFFEELYNTNNEKDIIGFDKKIIVFEDIDCVGDIVLSREHQKKPEIQVVDSKDIVAKICEVNVDDPITLDDILNLWDGIRETPGRIMVISSNHYDKLDPALKRPGRIDITLELGNASRQSIREIYKHLFEKDIAEEILLKIPEQVYSPAQIINFYMGGEKDEETFIQKLILTKTEPTNLTQYCNWS